MVRLLRGKINISSLSTGDNVVKHWSEICLETKAFHESKQLEYGKGEVGAKVGWAILDTARALCRSVGWVSESIQIAEKIPKKPGLLKLPSREKAIQAIRPNNPYLPNGTNVTVLVGEMFYDGVISGHGFIEGKQKVYIIALETPAFIAGQTAIYNVAIIPSSVSEK